MLTHRAGDGSGGRIGHGGRGHVAPGSSLLSLLRLWLKWR
jgi:hypothetical protein